MDRSITLESNDIIERLGLIPLPVEGGMYSQTYVSEFLADGRPAGTAIYYLLRAETFSHLHYLDVDEIYHFYLGDPVELYQIDTAGNLTMTLLGQDITSGQELQAVVHKGVWQGSRLVAGGKWALLGTTTTPGYLDTGYTHADREKLIKSYPQHEKIIKILTEKVRSN
jgi:hypothetical protein